MSRRRETVTQSGASATDQTTSTTHGPRVPQLDIPVPNTDDGLSHTAVSAIFRKSSARRSGSFRKCMYRKHLMLPNRCYFLFCFVLLHPLLLHIGIGFHRILSVCSSSCLFAIGLAISKCNVLRTSFSFQRRWGLTSAFYCCRWKCVLFVLSTHWRSRRHRFVCVHVWPG